MKSKITIIIVLIALSVSLLSPVLLWPKRIVADIGDFMEFGGSSVSGGARLTQSAAGTPGLVVADIGMRLQQIGFVITDFLKSAYKVVRDVAFKNAIKYFMNKVAYDTATYIATGDKGQKPLFISEGWDAYFTNVRDETYAKFFLDVGDKVWGKDLCQPLDPLAKVRIDIYARRAFDPTLGQKPRCTWQTIQKNLSDVRKMTMDQLVDFSYYFHPGGGSDIGAWLTITSGAKEVARENLAREELVRQIEGEFKSLKSTISGQIKTPASTIKKTFEDVVPLSLQPYFTYTGTAIADAIGVFTNTLTSKLIERVFKKGFNPQADRTGLFSLNLFGGFSLQQAAREQFAELGKPDYSLGGSVDVINQLSIDCGTAEYGGEQFCETIDHGFARAIEQKLTVKQAVEQGLLKGDRPFGFKADGTEPSYVDGISYRSILVLRKYRIVPVGWELAAQYIKNFGTEQFKELGTSQSGAPSKTIGLKTLMDKYNDSSSPFYKLIDPGWQLKAPETICARSGPGPDIIDVQYVCDKDTSKDGNISCPPDGADEASVYITRRTYCADERSCIMESDDGNSCKFYGYCTEEKPIWRIAGDMCPAYFNTCQTFTKSDGDSESYLENTLATCTEPWCAAYCIAFNPENDEWVCNSNDLIHYKSNTTCSVNEEGCQNLIRLLNFDQTALSRAQVEALIDGRHIDNTGYLEVDTNLKIAPEYSESKYSCEGYTQPLSPQPTGDNLADKKNNCLAQDNYWRDDLEICVESGNKYCSNFALYCSDQRASDNQLDWAKNVSCKLYTPISIDEPAVPAVINTRLCQDGNADCPDSEVSQWNDECPASCVGFRNYYQMQTQFEAGGDESFIASTAKKCTQSGCDEFTNLDEVARGGEGREYFTHLRLCVDPSSDSVATFYTWEGSDTAGYQLKKWQLESQGDAPVGYDSVNECSIGDQGIDCREFYNPTSGEYYPTDFSKVVFASDDCHPYRRTLDNIVYNGIPSYSTRCNAGNAGCRTYRDNSSYNYQVILRDDFEKGIGNWQGIGGSSVNISSESVRRGGHSMITQGASIVLSQGDLTFGDSYAVSFLAKGSGSISFMFESSGSALLSSGSQTLSNEWQLYNVNMDMGELLEEPTGAVNFRIEGIQGYIDDIILKKINNILVIKNSWEQNTTCQNLSLNWCEAYKDNSGKIWNLQNFSDLCLEEVVGCEAFIKFNETGSREWVFLVNDKNKTCNSPGCTSLGELERDKYEPGNSDKFNFEDKFMVINPSLDTCSVQNEGCEQMNYGDNTGYAYYKDPMDRTCEFKDGEWWVFGEQGVKCPRTTGVCYGFSSCDTGCPDSSCDTITNLCRGKLKCSDNSVCDGDNNFCLISKQPQDDSKYCLGGKARSENTLNMKDNNICEKDSDCIDYYDFANPDLPNKAGICTSWTGICSSSESGCQEYQDPDEPVMCDDKLLPYQKSGRYEVYEDNQTPACNFYYYKNVDSQSCSGINPDEGCQGFVDTSR